jgi:5-oxoprolinase (ATP-hydrolysing)
VPPDAVREQLFANRFEGIVREMGEQLRRTAVSVNVKERLDYSCALLDPAGELVVNAPHIPVHLGAMGVCVRAVAAHVDLAPGDVVVTNHPGFGGSHLPDLTVITPVHSADGTRLGYVASRAHHAEIGGTRPGSMPPDATTLEEEGVVIPPTFLIERGVARWERVTAMLTDARYPSRAVDDNLADLRAQVAANHRARTLLVQLAASAGVDTIAAQMAAIMSRSERSMRAALHRMPEGRYTATEFLDDGSPIAVAIEITSGSVTFDFTGTADVHPGNLNATRAIVRSAILYLSRLLVDEPLPLNEGLLRPVRVILPRCLLDPGFASAGSPVVASAESSSPPANTPPANGETFFPASGANRVEPSVSGTVSRRDPTGLPAVVGGNTEVSQRLVDTMIRALGIAACGQGTMNNILWGTDRFGYYETIAGGEGATEGHHGANAVHTHMTNTRITDVEVLEARFPVRIDRFAVRRGSGGVGRWRGGDGVVREFTFLAPMSVSVLTQHRTAGPFGVAGGGPGLPGAQEVVRADGATVRLASVDGCEVLPGDRLRVETPGGGGWGKEGETC